MLRASSQHDGVEYDLSAINEGYSGDSGIPHSAVLLDFADAVLGDDARQLTAARRQLLTELGEAALVDTAGIVGMFNALDRVANATGIPLEDAKAASSEDIRESLGMSGFFSEVAN